MDFDLDPPRGVGPLRLGMPRAEANIALEQLRDVHELSPSDIAGRHIFRPSGLMISIGCQADRLIAVEFTRPQSTIDRVRFQDVDLFTLSAREVIERLGALVRIEPNPDEPASVVAPDLLLSLWRAFEADDEPDEEQGYYFNTVLVAQPGYYDTPAEAALRAAQEMQQP
jgi:hypothetical protein